MIGPSKAAQAPKFRAALTGRAFEGKVHSGALAWSSAQAIQVPYAVSMRFNSPICFIESSLLESGYNADNETWIDALTAAL